MDRPPHHTAALPSAIRPRRTPGGTPAPAATAGAVSVRLGAVRRARCSAGLGAQPRRSQRSLGRFGPRELLPKSYLVTPGCGTLRLASAAIKRRLHFHLPTPLIGFYGTKQQVVGPFIVFTAGRLARGHSVHVLITSYAWGPT